MSLCLATKFSGAALGLGTLAQIAPVDPSAGAVAIYSKFGLIGLLIAVVVALWIDGKREAKSAEERRAKRDEKDDLRHEEMVKALGGLKASIDTNAAKCDATRTLAQDALKK